MKNAKYFVFTECIACNFNMIQHYAFKVIVRSLDGREYGTHNTHMENNILSYVSSFNFLNFVLHQFQFSVFFIIFLTRPDCIESIHHLCGAQHRLCHIFSAALSYLLTQRLVFSLFQGSLTFFNPQGPPSRELHTYMYLCMTRFTQIQYCLIVSQLVSLSSVLDSR